MPSNVIPELLVGGHLRLLAVLPACVSGCDFHDVLIPLHLLLGPECAGVPLGLQLQRPLLDSCCFFGEGGLEVGGELF